MASVHQRSGRWRVRYRDAGGTNRSQAGFKTEREARQWADDIERRMRGGTASPDPRAERQSLADAISIWVPTLAGTVTARTAKDYRSICELYLGPMLGHLPIGGIDRAAVLDAKQKMIDDSYADATIAKAMTVLRLVLDDAYERGGLDRANPASRLRLRKPVPRSITPLTWPQVERLAAEVAAPPAARSPRPQIAALHGSGLTAAQIASQLSIPAPTVHYHLKHLGEPPVGARDDLGLLVRFAGATGLRANEIVTLVGRRLDLEDATVEVAPEHAKSGRTRRVPVPKPLLEPLSKLVAGAFDPVWRSASGSPIDYANFYSRRFVPATVRAQLPGVHFHDLRHTFASMLIADGADARTVMDLMGHSSITVTYNVYGHLFPGQARAAVEGIAARLAAGRA